MYRIESIVVLDGILLYCIIVSYRIVAPPFAAEQLGPLLGTLTARLTAGEVLPLTWERLFNVERQGLGARAETVR